MNKSFAIRMQEISKHYLSGAGKVEVLRQVNFDFPRGEMTAVMGPSGSGKSTLLQCAAGLDRPSGGNVWLGATPISDLNDKELTAVRRDRIGFIFQAFNLLPMLNVYENVALPLRLSGQRPKKSEILKVLHQVGLEKMAHRRPAELSGGQQQRVAIARTLVSRPEVLFADEPTGSLDTATGRQVLGLLRSVVDDYGQTVVMVTHDPAAAAWANRVVFLVDGQIRGVLERPTVQEITARVSQWEEGR